MNRSPCKAYYLAHQPLPVRAGPTWNINNIYSNCVQISNGPPMRYQTRNIGRGEGAKGNTAGIRVEARLHRVGVRLAQVQRLRLGDADQPVQLVVGVQHHLQAPPDHGLLFGRPLGHRLHAKSTRNRGGPCISGGFHTRKVPGNRIIARIKGFSGPTSQAQSIKYF